MQESLSRLLLFNKLDSQTQRKIVAEMYERTCVAGEILIKEGDTGLAASELYVVKSGKYEVRGLLVGSHALISLLDAACSRGRGASCASMHRWATWWPLSLALVPRVRRCCSDARGRTFASTSRSAVTASGRSR